MTAIPAEPKIYHITHVENLPRIVEAGVIWSDAKRMELGLESRAVGMSVIKERRLKELVVKCHPGRMVGQFVPFCFCPRSVMLYILHKGNHPELSYRGGQDPIVHLVADLRRTIAWADGKGRPWAFSERNAGASYASFYARLDRLDRINWAAVANTDFRDPLVKEGKQAEFLLYKSFPWELVEAIGVRDANVLGQVEGILEDADHRPEAATEDSWYY